jgi:3'-phosphoadenosine 5'-phosphosulfate sulfotransferase (PAPS reductase)/FAD synthetase
MRDPYLCDGPTVVSFSGGRTSGLMLRRVLDAHGGELPPDVHVLFSNTGRERLETLDFVAQCARQWDVPIHWIERPAGGGVVEVDFDTASRNGEPFDALIAQRNFLPNPTMRFCTQELKIRVMRDWMRARGYEHWVNAVGMRADEPRRVANGRASEGRDRWTLAYPLFDAGVTVADVAAFWAAQPFDLALQSYEGNCDLCFLKGFAKRARIIEERPDLAAWWIDAERRIGATFRAHEPSYQRVLDWTKTQRRLPMVDDLTSVDCGCTD